MGFIYHFPEPFGIPHFQTYQYCTVRTDISDIVAAEAAFAALRTDGTVIAWGNPHFGGSVWVPKMSQSVDLVGWHIKNIYIYCLCLFSICKMIYENSPGVYSRF
jgi:alpha-tubulin suppressor-like RCC1 family protein